MKDKNLPIRLFNKRKEHDERRVEGGGDKKPPKWVLSGDELSSRMKTLINDIELASNVVENQLKSYEGVPAVMKAKMSGDSLAKSHRKDIKELLNGGKSDRLIGISGDDDLLIRVDSSMQLDVIKKNISISKNDKAISAIEHINANSAPINLDSFEKINNKYLIKLRLVNFLDTKLNEKALHHFKKLINSLDDVTLEKSVKYTENLIVHQLEATTLDSLNTISEYSSVLSIEAMPVMEIHEDDFLGEFDGGAPLPKEGKKYQIVGILDSGITLNSPLLEWTVEKRHSNYPYNLINPSHGTFVSGILNFGDHLEGNDWTGNKKFMLYDGAVFPNERLEKISESDLVNNIREAIENSISHYGDEVKIWNLSLGSKYESDLNNFSDLAIALDSMQDEFKVLFIKSAGNCKNFLSGNPISRIANGADSVRALTVGSIAHSKREGDLSNENGRSPFSRIGPGPAEIVKPELVHYGGNHTGLDDEESSNGVTSLSIEGKKVRNIGTSFSTPRITALAASLNEELEGDFDSLLIKALLIHSAKYPQNNELSTYDTLNEIGFGIPEKVDDILYNNEFESTLILRDVMNKGEFIEILDFPYPESLIDDNGYYYGQISLTLVSSPLLREGQGAEYCQSNIKVAFGTYDEKVSRDISKPTITNPIGKLNNINVLNTDIYSKRKNPEASGFNREKMLVKYGEKFYPNKKYVVDLSEIKQSPKDKYMKHPKKWFMKIEGLFRDHIESRAEIEGIDLAQEFCIIITIKDPRKEKNVYEEVFQQLDLNNFHHTSINLSTEIEIETDSDFSK